MLTRQPKLQRYLLYSAGIHSAIFFAFLFQAILFPQHALLLQPTVQVDLVDLPNQVKAPDAPLDTSLPVNDKAPPPEPQTKAEPDEPKPLAKPIDKEKVKLDAKKALDKLKAEVEKQREAERKAMIEKERERLKSIERSRQAIRGNQVNQGTSATGVMEQTLNAYGGHVTEVLRSHWALPTWLQSRNLRAVVRIYINGRGQISNYVFRMSSGNEAFDGYVTDTIKRSSFLPPPAEMARQLQTSGLEVSFPL